MQDWQSQSFDLRKRTNLKSLVDVVSTFLLGLLLLPKLKATARDFGVNPHLTVVSSSLHNAAMFSERNSKNIFDELKNKEKTVVTDR
jgi:retinol dehydrogenase-12